MNNLRDVIEVLFCKTDPEDILKAMRTSLDLTEAKNINDENFIKRAEALNYRKSWDELNAMLQLAKTEWFHAPSEGPASSDRHLFYLLARFTGDVLTERADCPICDFSQLLRWRELSHIVGEDLLTTAFLAYSDVGHHRERHYFSWSPTISNNNIKLRNIIHKGLTDIHFHLMGSSLIFDIGWLSLMNDVLNRQSDFEQLGPFRNPDVRIKSDSTQTSLYLLYVKAVALRQFLFKILTKNIDATTTGGKEKTLKDIGFYNKILSCTSKTEINIYLRDLQNETDLLRYLYGKRYDREIIDYAIRPTLAPRNYEPDSLHNSILYGERWLLYKMFQVIFSKKDDRCGYKPYFYAYLLIKNRIRKEIIQQNNYPGFHNFQDYQNRKTLFIPKGSIYEKLLYSYSIKNPLYGQHVKYLEARISPCDSAFQNKKRIEHIDKMVELPSQWLFNGSRELEKLFRQSKAQRSCRLFDECQEQETFCRQKESCRLFHDNKDKDSYFFIFHFLKQQEADTKSLIPFSSPRDVQLRKTVKKQAVALNQLRQLYNDAKKRFVGVDAAGHEIGTRPEVFAQAFRYLKYSSCELNNIFLQSAVLPSLGYTYHVGEDFLDIADGLRAIDETIKFLNFKQGDRLGHALALGVSPADFYARKQNRITLTKQNLLDNIVWLIIQISRYNISCSQTLLLNLQQYYNQLFTEIYLPYCKPATTSYKMYYMSWLLRGDDPLIYRPHFLDSGNFSALSNWENCALNNYSQEIVDARKNIEVRKLYYNYHFNAEARKKGAEFCEYKIPNGYIQLIEQVQNAFMFDIARKQIAIESCPTSNKLIGAYSLYENLPIKRFFNLGLTVNPEEINACPQISVSINTDDAGVFASNIENEYALIAAAMEKAKNADGSPRYNSQMIYDWLERIRTMGHEQRFLQKNY